MPSIEVAAGLVFRDNRLLITRRHPNSHLGGLWEFPGGKRHPRETMIDCLHRELMEELGIEVEVRGRLDQVTHRYPEKTVHIEFFQCRWTRHEPRPLGCHDLRWIERHELAAFEFPEADLVLVQRLRDDPALWIAEPPPPQRKA